MMMMNKFMRIWYFQIQEETDTSVCKTLIAISFSMEIFVVLLPIRRHTCDSSTSTGKDIYLIEVVVFAVIPRLTNMRVFHAIPSLSFILIFQYVLRVLRICSLLKEATRSTGILAETAWAKGAFNLFLYMLASHVRLFQNMDKRLHDAICDHLKLLLYIQHSFILREGDPLDEILFITRGKLLTCTNAGSAGADFLGKGDFYGQELLDWVLKTDPNPSLSNLPFSTKTVQAHTKVEVFVLRAYDLKAAVSKFWWLVPSLDEWRHPRAAHALQTAWRRYKLLKALRPIKQHGDAINFLRLSGQSNSMATPLTTLQSHNPA